MKKRMPGTARLAKELAQLFACAFLLIAGPGILFSGTDELFRRAGDAAVQLAGGNKQGAVSSVIAGAIPSQNFGIRQTQIYASPYGAGISQPVLRPIQAGPVNFSGSYNAYTGPLYTYPYPTRPPSWGQNLQANTSSKAFNTSTTFSRS